MRIVNKDYCMTNVEDLKWQVFKAYIDNMQGGGCYEPYRVYHIEGSNRFLEICKDNSHEIVSCATYTIDELIKNWKSDILTDYDLGFISHEAVTKMGIVIPKKGVKNG